MWGPIHKVIASIHEKQFCQATWCPKLRIWPEAEWEIQFTKANWSFCGSYPGWVKHRRVELSQDRMKNHYFSRWDQKILPLRFSARIKINEENMWTWMIASSRVCTLHGKSYGGIVCYWIPDNTRIKVNPF